MDFFADPKQGNKFSKLSPILRLPHEPSHLHLHILPRRVALTPFLLLVFIEWIEFIEFTTRNATNPSNSTNPISPQLSLVSSVEIIYQSSIRRRNGHGAIHGFDAGRNG
jgi:hypothetical protein